MLSIALNKKEEIYLDTSREAFQALTWVEIGFEGLPSLAVSPASINWTSGVGHLVNDEERAKGIMSGGKKFYEDCLGKFARYRSRQGITGDYFSKYNLEHLLQTIPQ